jgi:phage baseplate assembly protein W
MAEREQLFGVDLALVERAGGVDLVDDGSGDLRLAAGNDTIVQALKLRLSVRRGELAPLGFADYGSRLHELVGEPNTRRTHLKLAAFARAAVEADPRVREVTDVRVRVLAGDRNTVQIALEVVLIDAPTPLNLVHTIQLEA